MPKYILLAILVLAACDRPQTITVRASIPRLDGSRAPLPDLSLVALPYDRDSVLAALEQKAPPRPHTAELDSLFARWRGPFRRYATAIYAAQQARDSLGRIRQRLDSLPRNAPEYQELYRQFGALTERLETTTDSADGARIELDRNRRELLPRIDSLRARVSAWENSTFAGYQQIVKGLGDRREPVAGTTGPEGTARLTLGPGRWWIYAWAWEEGDPYSRWYWNVPVTEETVVLDETTGRTRPQY